jgi:hypothetical protein
MFRGLWFAPLGEHALGRGARTAHPTGSFTDHSAQIFRPTRFSRTGTSTDAAGCQDWGLITRFFAVHRTPGITTFGVIRDL